MISLRRRSFLLGAVTLAAPALIIRTPGLPSKVVPSLLMPEPRQVYVRSQQIWFKVIMRGYDEAGNAILEQIDGPQLGEIFWGAS